MGGREWSLSMERTQGSKYGKLSFAEDLAFECQVLGSESYDSNTWKWGWANDDVPQDMLQASSRLRASDLGPEFTEPQFPLTRANGHQIAAVASGVLKTAACYSGSTEGGKGRVFLLITDANFPSRTPETSGDALRIVRSVGQALELGWVKAPVVAIDAFLRTVGAEVEKEGTYKLAGGSVVELGLSDDGKVRMSAQLAKDPNAPPCSMCKGTGQTIFGACTMCQ